MLINPQIEEMAKEVYTEMKRTSKTESVFNTPLLGEMKIFISQKPKASLFEFTFDGDTVYIGSNEI